MADRFPSLEDFDSGAPLDIKSPSLEPSADDFLAREKAALGEDADLFATGDDAGALGGGGQSGEREGGDAEPSFETQFPDLAPGGGNGGEKTVSGPSIAYNSGYQTQATEVENEPEVIKEWRERRDAQIEKRSEQFAAQRQATIKEAQQNIDDFYENYNKKREKGTSQTRKEAEKFLAERDDVVAGGTSWDRIAKLVDVSGKGSKGGAAGSGKERFREVLASLRKDEKAPGATGY